ncbi:unnamed protein product [Rotaria sp. Silwood2]|nr:unnamed protein product [Rotaria sp. Silwood2]CAF2566167.1 unnamed protein product [Rotaria sp. Silwood2]CAF4036217.1 unnamed protein product [Rotaria sp. Silwood2]CAF4058208.1 unnamed protein product [Rotaria sp. Silwood2]
MSSIHEAAVAGNSEKLKLLIENGANVNLKDSKGLRPLHYATWQGRTESVFILLRSGANVNEQSLDGDTPLHLASQYGHHEIVQLLLFHHADPTILNRRQLTSIELACEHGHLHVVNSLIHNKLCQQMILNNSNNNEQITPLHLAAKNGHTDIVRLLLLNGIDINRMTINDGSALHVACRNGRYETAKLLLECGIDVNLRNSYEQTASEVVIKQKSGNDIKRLIKEFSDAILVRAIRSYADNHVGALNFSEGDSITVLDRNPTGQWRGFILQDDLTTRTGYFPSTYVQLNTTSEYLINGKEAQSYIDNHSPIDIDSMSRSSQVDSALTTVSSWSSRSKRHSPTNNIYRHSAASSIDSGRSSTLLYDSPKTLALSSFMGIGDARSICSNESKSSDPDKTSYRSSNSSLDESGTLNINRLLRNCTSENEIVVGWLREFSYDNYAENFITNGYDMQTIVRMTPEDLTAIGITHPSHRRKIKNEIARLHLPDGLPDFKPDTLYDWLCYLRLDEYMSLLNKQNYKKLSDVINIAWEDLEDIGITRLGHQKRFMLAIKRLIDIDKGLYQPNPNKIISSPINRIKSTMERSNSLEHNEFIQKAFMRSPSNGDSSPYATLRKPQFSPNSLTNKQRIGSSGTYIPTLSFRLPPPLSSTIINSSINNYQSMGSNRTRSLESIHTKERKLDINHNQRESIPSQCAQHSTIINNNLQLLHDINLSSSTESTNCIPFANENIGTIKQRSPIDHYNTLKVKQSFDTIKRSLPIEFFQQSNIHSMTTTPIYDNNEHFIHKTKISPCKQIKKTSLTATEREASSSNTDKHLQYIEMSKKNKENKITKHDTTNVLSDIDSMLSDLNRELDQMLDYETKTSI